MGRKSFTFSKEQKREKQLSHFFLHRVCESRIKRVLSARSFEEERGQREVFVLVAEEEDLLLARAVGCFVLERERERERFCAFVVEKSSPISEAAASSSFAGQIFFLLSSSARTFKKRREK